MNSDFVGMVGNVSIGPWSVDDRRWFDENPSEEVRVRLPFPFELAAMSMDQAKERDLVQKIISPHDQLELRIAVLNVRTGQRVRCTVMGTKARPSDAVVFVDKLGNTETVADRLAKLRAVPIASDAANHLFDVIEKGKGLFNLPRDGGWLGSEGHKNLLPRFHDRIHPGEILAAGYDRIGKHSHLTEEEKQGHVDYDLVALCATATWGRLGFPSFSLTDDFFHALAITDFGDSSDEALNLPFPAFILAFPENSICGGARKAFVYRDVPPSRSCLALGLERITLTYWKSDATRKEFNSRYDGRNNVGSPNPLIQTQIDTAARVLANTLTYINANGGLPDKKHGHGSPSCPVEREAIGPVFRVGRTVKLAPIIRKTLREGAAGAHWKLAHRFIVRGHWRNQAFGPARSERKRLWIEPHWKGPETLDAAFTRTYSVE